MWTLVNISAVLGRPLVGGVLDPAVAFYFEKLWLFSHSKYLSGSIIDILDGCFLPERSRVTPALVWRAIKSCEGSGEWSCCEPTGNLGYPLVEGKSKG